MRRQWLSLSRVARTAAGWTLPELIVVLAIVSIVAAVAVPRFFDQNVFRERAYAMELAAAARLARSIAVSGACPVRLIIDNGGFRARQPPAAGTHCASAASGFSRNVVRLDGSTLQAVAPANLPFVGTLQWTFNTDGSVQIVGGNSLVAGPHTVVVDPVTGLVRGP